MRRPPASLERLAAEGLNRLPGRDRGGDCRTGAGGRRRVDLDDLAAYQPREIWRRSLFGAYTLHVRRHHRERCWPRS